MDEEKLNLIKWLLKYRMKEILLFIIICLVFILFSLMLSYTPGKGWEIRPAADVKIEVKK